MSAPNPEGCVVVRRSDRRRLRIPWSALVANKAGEIWTKAGGRRIRGQGMIGADAATVRDGFASLGSDGFETYNLPQVWVESRTIPKVIANRVPAAGAVVLDLGCGRGDSTRFLCYFADPSWRIVGMDLTPSLIEDARRACDAGAFRNRHGHILRPEFHVQDLAAPLRMNGAPMPCAFADLAISCGVVGLYMQPAGARTLLAELRIAVKPCGVIALDAGPAISARSLRALAAEQGLEFEARVRSCAVDPRPKLVFRRPT